jgi:hypothetical protein
MYSDSGKTKRGRGRKPGSEKKIESSRSRREDQKRRESTTTTVLIVKKRIKYVLFVFVRVYANDDTASLQRSEIAIVIWVQCPLWQGLGQSIIGGEINQLGY